MRLLEQFEQCVDELRIVAPRHNVKFINVIVDIPDVRPMTLIPRFRRKAVTAFPAGPPTPVTSIVLFIWRRVNEKVVSSPAVEYQGKCHTKRETPKNHQR